MTLRFLPLFIALLGSLLAAAAEPAMAQTTPALSATIAPVANVRLGPGQESTLTWTVSVTGATVAGTVAPSVRAPEGWVVEASTTSFPMGGGQNAQDSQEIPVRISLPADADGIQNGSLVLVATFTNTAGQTDSAEQTVFLTYLAPQVAAPPPPPNYTWAITAAVLGGILLTIVGVYVAQARRVGLDIATPVKRLNIGTGGAYKVIVRNRTGAPQNVELRVLDLPQEWSAAFSFPVVPLRGGEKSEVPLWVNVPLEANANERRAFRIQARPNRFSPWLVSRKLEVSTLDVVIPGKPTPA